MKKLNEMTKKEKKEFLSMDLIERLIRLEQRVSASFGQFIPYSQTEYFKNLSEREKREFVKYLKKNKRKKYLLGSFFFFLVAGAIFLHGSFTAKVVEENLKIQNTLFTNILLILFLIFIFITVMFFLSGKRRKKRLKSHFDIIDKLYLKKVNK